MGTPDFAVPTLTGLHEDGHTIAAVYTRAPRPAGRRGLELVPSPVQVAAERCGLEVWTPPRLSPDDEVARLATFKPEAIVVVAYGLILPKRVLDIPPSGCLNLHASLLPRWRGAAPIQRAIMAGDPETGVMVMRMEEGLDTGPIALTARMAIGPEARADEISAELASVGAGLMVQALARLAQGKLSFTPQAADGVTYAHKIDKAEARIDWTRPAKELHNLIRALAPFPGAYFEADLGRGIERIKVLRTQMIEGAAPPGFVLDAGLSISCGRGALRLIEVQRAGRAPMTGQDFLRGVKLKPGAPLTPKPDAAL